MKINVSVILINYNTNQELNKSLTRLIANLHNIEIIVVDNNSKNSPKKIPDIQYIKNSKNKGFSFAANQGALLAKGRWLLFLNPDVQITVEEINNLYHYAENNQLDAVSPLFSDERYRKAVPNLSSLLSEFSPLKALKMFENKQRTLVGGCLMIKKKVLRELGGWDERFFLWFEDTDLTKQLIDKHYSIGFAPFSVTHQGGASVKQLSSTLQRDIFFHSLEIYLRKHFPKLQTQLLLYSVIRRFTRRLLYPVRNPETSWVVPNMDLDLIHDFLNTNYSFFEKNEDEVIIVSSKLTSKNIWEFRKQYPLVRFIMIEQNKGFSSTVNIGFRVATTQWVGTVNDDTILNSKTLTELKNYAKQTFGSLNPIIYSLDQTMESAGVKVLPKGKALPILVIPQKLKTVVDASNAACVLYNTTALNQVGLYDEKFGSYLEDIDLSLRMKKASFPNIVIKSSTIIHLKHQTSKKMGKYKQYLDMKNWWLVIIKNWPLPQLVLYLPIILMERLRNISGFFK